MVAWMVVALLASGAEAGDGWHQVVDGDVKVYARSVPGQRVAEVKATMTMRATALEVREVLNDDDYVRHAPYVAETRIIEHPAENVWVRYTRLSLPIVHDRDYFIEITNESDLGPGGTGEFRTSWKPWGLDRPSRRGVVRVTNNEGYWLLKPSVDGQHAEVEYYLRFDPGGAIPGWAVDHGNKKVLPDVMHALEREALRRRDEGASAGMSAAPAP